MMDGQEAISVVQAQEDYLNSSSSDQGSCPEQKMLPLVNSQVSSSAESVFTILNDFENYLFIPEYQRDSDQWANDKKSRFIESILNNLTVPSFIYARCQSGDDDGLVQNEVVDGQQRILLLQDFRNNNFRLLQSKDVDYIANNAIYYEGKTYDELPDIFKRIFDSYKISIIYLPESIEDSVRFETFRRLNQTPNTLSSQDIRLSQFPYAKISMFLRVAGIFNLSKYGSQRMLKYAQENNIEWPWIHYDQKVQTYWYNWWKNKKSNLGQKPSEMVLWYIVGLYHRKINNLLNNSKHLANELNMAFMDNIDNVADIVLSQMSYEENNELKILCSLSDMQDNYFPKFVELFTFFIQNYPSSFNVQRARFIAFIFSGLVNYNINLLQDYHINMIDRFISSPRETSADLGIVYPETKGRWFGKKGLYNQIINIHRIIDKIME